MGDDNMVHEKIIEVESVEHVTGRGTILVVRIPLEWGDPVIGTDILNIRTGRPNHKVCFAEGMLKPMGHPYRAEIMGLGVSLTDECQVGDKLRILLKKKD